MMYNIIKEREMKVYDVYQCDKDPSVYAMYVTSNHVRIEAKSPADAKKQYRAMFNAVSFVRASFVCNK